MKELRKPRLIALGALLLAAFVGLTVVACDGGGSPTAPKAAGEAVESAAPEGGDAASAGLPEGGLEGEEPVAPNGEPEFPAMGEPILETDAAKGGQPKQELCHWDKDAMVYVLITVGQPGFDNHLKNHSMDKPLPTWWLDADGDGFGDSAVSTQACDQPAGYVDNDDDCQDDASSCTTDCSQDDDGDGVPSCRDQCWDADGDGYGFDATGETIGGGAIAVGGCTTDGSTPCDLGDPCDGEDCDDTDATINPAADDAVCDGVDDNCDGTPDDEYVTTPTSCGIGECAATGDLTCVGGAEVDSCTAGTPSPEICDDLDNNCDGDVDEGDVCVVPCGKTVFVSSATYTGNFGGGMKVLGHLDADDVCQSLANGAGLGGSFKAWISGRVDTGDGPLFHGVDDRFTMASEPYCLVDDTIVADDWSDLTDGSLDNPIDLDEYGAAVGMEVRVWTNTTTSGAASDNSTQCAQGIGPDDTGIWSWSCGSPSWSPGDCANQAGRFGIATSTGGDWTASSFTSCSNSFHLYCFEQ